jgi:putative isomerase
MILIPTTIRAGGKIKTNSNSIFEGIAPMDNPINMNDPAQNLFMDEGAWFGFALPETNHQISGFVGPYLMQYKYGGWLSTALINIKPVIKSENLSMDIESSMAYFDAGKLHLNIKYNNGINIDQSLQYISAKSVLINVSLHADSEIESELQWFGELLIDKVKYENIAGGFQFSLDNGLRIQARFSDPKIDFNLSENTYKSISTDPIKIAPPPFQNRLSSHFFQKKMILIQKLN